MIRWWMTTDLQFAMDQEKRMTFLEDRKQLQMLEGVLVRELNQKLRVCWETRLLSYCISCSHTLLQRVYVLGSVCM